jgi:hypothetical protein
VEPPSRPCEREHGCCRSRVRGFQAAVGASSSVLRCPPR